MSRMLGATVAALIWLLVPASPASAHAVLLRTDPATEAVVEAAPTQIRLEFSEPVRLSFGGIRVFDDKLARVDRGEPRLVGPSVATIGLRPLARGTYIVGWRAISADTHPVRGAFTFSVGAATPTRSGGIREALSGFGSASRTVLVAAGVARALGYLSALVLFGALIFLLVAWRGAPRGGRADRSMAASIRKLALRVWPVALAASILVLTTEASTEAGGAFLDGFGPRALGPVLGSQFGRVWLVRVGLLLALLPAILRMSRGATGSITALAGVLAGGVVATPAFWGHAVTTTPQAAAVASDAGHLLSVAAWLGGLACLLFVVPRALSGVDPSERAASLAVSVPRFSSLALVSVSVLVGTGTYLTVLQVTSWSSLFGSSYGRVIVAKIIGLALALVLATFNLVRTRTQLRRAADRPGDSERWNRLLRRAVAGEAVLAVSVLILASALVSLAPPRTTGAGGAVAELYTRDASIGPDRVQVGAYPMRTGRPVEIHLTFTAAGGAPDDAVRAASVALTQLDADLGPFAYEGRRVAPGHFVVSGVRFPATGRWRMELSALRGEFERHIRTFTFPVG